MVFFRKNIEIWHKWFAWHPVRVKSSKPFFLKYVWLTTIYRKCTHMYSWNEHHWEYSYKEIKDYEK